MSEWLSLPLKDLVAFQKGKKVEVFDAPVEGGVPYIGASSLEGAQAVLFSHTSNTVVSEDTDVLMLWDGERSGLVGTGLSGVVGSTVSRLRPTGIVDHKFLYFKLADSFSWIQQNRTGTGVPHVPKDLGKILSISYPGDLIEQREIAKILSTVDNLIEKTQNLIDKYQSIKQGMMHDLFTRGVYENGQLRPSYEEAPHLYKESELGWIPKEWKVCVLANIAESLIDGPFGSNLKTEHYVEEPGVRVVRLQNIEVDKYDDTERAYVSLSHAQTLSRHEVLPGDVLIGGMGEEKHPVGRACVYPDDLPPAINKADCFRLRCDKRYMVNSYASYFLNSYKAKPQIYRYSQGVTRVRVNSGNLRKMLLTCPGLTEQVLVVQMLVSIERLMAHQDTLLKKLNKEKTGLMQDLLTGKVRVKVDA